MFLVYVVSFYVPDCWWRKSMFPITVRGLHGNTCTHARTPVRWAFSFQAWGSIPEARFPRKTRDWQHKWRHIWSSSYVCSVILRPPALVFKMADYVVLLKAENVVQLKSNFQISERDIYLEDLDQSVVLPEAFPNEKRTRENETQTQTLGWLVTSGMISSRNLCNLCTFQSFMDENVTTTKKSRTCDSVQLAAVGKSINNTAAKPQCRLSDPFLVSCLSCFLWRLAAHLAFVSPA